MQGLKYFSYLCNHKNNYDMKRILLSIASAALCLGLTAQPKYDYSKLSTERLDRGVVAVRQSDGKVFVSWRILRDDQILLVHARNFRGPHYGLVAGFVETGETLEQAVEREVWEETRLRISNLRYFGSQPWPYPCGLMVGFTADYASGELHLQREELGGGGWFDRDHLPLLPDNASIARRLIDDWAGNA